MQHRGVQGCTVLFPWHNTHRSSPSVRGKLGQFQTRLRIPHWSWSPIWPLGLCFQLLKRRHIYFRFSKKLLTALHWNSYQISCAMQMYRLMYGKFSLNIRHIVIFRAYIPKKPKCLEKQVFMGKDHSIKHQWEVINLFFLYLLKACSIVALPRYICWRWLLKKLDLF